MKVYMDTAMNEIVTEDVAIQRLNNDMEDYEMEGIVSNIPWHELRQHLDADYIVELYDKYREETFDDRFEEYEFIESE